MALSTAEVYYIYDKARDEPRRYSQDFESCECSQLIIYLFNIKHVFIE